MRRRPGPGVLVNISSGAATKPYEGWAAYCASKAAVDQLTGCVALEEARHGLRAYALSPGLVDTDMQAAIRASDERDFPEVERFRRFAADGPVQLAGLGGRPHPGPRLRRRRPRARSSVRVPEQPVPGAAG